MIDYSNKCLITEIMYFKILGKNCNFFFLCLIKRKLRKGGGGSKRTKKNPSTIFNVSPPPFSILPLLKILDPKLSFTKEEKLNS